MIMQINELEISRKLKRYMMGSDLANLLRQYGWTPLGYGFEAGVAEHPRKSYVLKIFPKNSVYVKFVNMVQQHAMNPHFPKFSRYVKTIPGTGYSYVRMEKLAPMQVYDLAQFPSLLCLLDQMWAKLNPKELPPYWVRNNVTWEPESSELPDCNELTMPAQEQEAIQLLGKTLSEIGWDHVDLHAGNFMLRGNTWVITDPFI